jgi:hypothetical protein
MSIQPPLEWPKKITPSQYAKRWYVKRTQHSVINDIKAGRLAGVKEGASWYVWVNADLTPCKPSQAPSLYQEKPALTPAAALAVQKVLKAAKG